MRSSSVRTAVRLSAGCQVVSLSGCCGELTVYSICCLLVMGDPRGKGTLHSGSFVLQAGIWLHQL